MRDADGTAGVAYEFVAEMELTNTAAARRVLLCEAGGVFILRAAIGAAEYLKPGGD